MEVWLVVFHISVWGNKAQLFPPVRPRAAYSTARLCVKKGIPLARRSINFRSPVELERAVCERFRLHRR